MSIDKVVNGVVDAYKAQRIYDGDILNGEIKSVIIQEKESMDIDTEFDFMLCELIMNLRSS